MMADLPLAFVQPNPDQPRRHFDPGALRELAESIAAEGLVQAIKVRPIGVEIYEIIAGERRWRAHKLLLDEGRLPSGKIRAEVTQMDDRERDLAAIIENLQRADISPMEEARAFQRMVEQGMTPEELAKRLGLAVFRVRWRLQLLRLDPAIAKMVEGGQIDRQQALEIAKLERPADQLRIVRGINSGNISGWGAVKAAVQTVADQASQVEMFTLPAPPTNDEVRTVRTMEDRIETMARLAATGWKDGQCKIAAKVSRDRARLMADKLAAMAKALGVMERELRAAGAQFEAAIAA